MTGITRWRISVVADGSPTVEACINYPSRLERELATDTWYGRQLAVCIHFTNPLQLGGHIGPDFIHHQLGLRSVLLLTGSPKTVILW